jgi:hypothetical protein
MLGRKPKEKNVRNFLNNQPNTLELNVFKGIVSQDWGMLWMALLWSRTIF